MRILAVALICLIAGLLVHSALRVGPTFDEHFYIASGLAYFENGDFSLNREHPPLLKLMAAAPIWSLWKLGLLDLHWPAHAETMAAFPSALIYQLNAASLGKLFFLARLPFVGLTLLMVIALWRKARSAFGEEAGIAAILLGGLNPNTIANGHLAALDGGVTALLFLAALAFAELLERPSWRATLKSGVTFGLANLAKSTALLLGPAMAALALFAALKTRSLRPLGLTAAAWFAGLGIFSLGYGFEAISLNEAWGNSRYISDTQLDESDTDHFEEFLESTRSALYADSHAGNDAALAEDCLTLGELQQAPQALRRDAAALLLTDPSERAAPERLAVLSQLTGRSFPDLDSWRRWFLENYSRNWDQQILTQPRLRKLIVDLFGYTRPIPLLPALVGLDYQLHHADGGHLSFYRGKVLLAPDDFVAGNPYPEYYSVILAIKNPVPFLLLFVVGLGLALARKTPWRRFDLAALFGIPALLFYTFSMSNMLMGMRYILPVLPFMALIAASTASRLPRATLLLACLSASSILVSHPNELMYYNALAGGNDLRSGGPAISVISDDWGQGVRRTGAFARRNAAALEQLGGFYYSPMTRASLRAFGLEGVPRPEPGVEGIVAVHALDYWRDSTGSSPPARVYAWLNELEPFAVIDDSVYLFDTRPGQHASPLNELDL